ncbi:uncharacterized protein LOC143283342 [Babylonia areolata]|uniref:uncharacterized protein LOC143283342 n=1 Tax=Babylonia areolata TaxID=304850 RepID=UPI003FD5FA06
MGKQSAEEVRKEVLDEDSRKDVSIYLSVPIGVVAGMSAMAAVCAVIVMRATVYFRGGVDAYWLSCAPFLFPVITGLFAAYKKQFSQLGVHMTVTLLALLIGGFGFGLSVEPIFLNRHQCVPVTDSVGCDKEGLAYLYLVCGAVAAGLCLLGLLMTVCALNSASKRMANRRYQAEVAHLKEQEEKQKQQRQAKVHHSNDVKPTTLSPATPPTVSQNAGANGVSQVPAQGNKSGVGENKADDITTKL